MDADAGVDVKGELIEEMTMPSGSVRMEAQNQLRQMTHLEVIQGRGKRSQNILDLLETKT